MINTLRNWASMIAVLVAISCSLKAENASQAARISPLTLNYVGSTTFSKPMASGSVLGQAAARKQSPFVQIHSQAHQWGAVLARQNRKSASPLAASLPSVSPSSVIGPDPGFRGFSALTGNEQASASGFDLEPPDQGLCTNGKDVMETINLATNVYDASTHKVLAGPVYLNNFFGVPATDFTSDPRCYYDPPTQRWFMSLTDLGGPSGSSTFILLAVSTTSDPTGTFLVYAFNVTNDGFYGDCPCFGDQPLLGADTNGIYISTNSYGAVFFAGAQIYALSKFDLVLGITPFGIHLTPLSSPGGSPYPFSLQPSISPDGQGDSSNGGSEYFVSSFDITSLVNSKVSIWAMTGTDTLTAAFGLPGFTNSFVNTESYVVPDSASQKAGPIPLGKSLGEPEGALNADDQRMQQVVYADGHLWSSVTTSLRIGANVLDGAAYFIIKPIWKNNIFSASVTKQGYVATASDNLIYPAIGVSDDAKGAMVFTLSGPDYFPSAAYVPITLSGTASAVRLAGSGVKPDDGFTIYPQYGGNGVGRWGDYSAAVAVSNDSVWIATEYIGPKKRDTLTNWGTFIGNLPLQ